MSAAWTCLVDGEDRDELKGVRQKRREIFEVRKCFDHVLFEGGLQVGL